MHKENLLKFFLMCYCLAQFRIQADDNTSNLIDRIERSRDTVTYYFNKELKKGGYVRKTSYTASYYDSIDLSELNESLITVPFITAFAPIVWLSNKDFTINEMDEDLFLSLIKIKKVFKFFWPQKSWNGNIVPSKLVNNKVVITNKFSTDKALLFSHGLDAISSAFLHYNEQPLLITMIWARLRPQDEAAFQERNANFAKTYGYPIRFWKTNFLNVFNTRKMVTDFGDTLNYSLFISGSAFPITYQLGLEKLYISSSFTKKRPYPHGSHPLIDNAICIGGVQTIHDDPESNRIEKIEKVVDFCNKNVLPLPYLLVCDSTLRNCNTCEKCLRTMNNILAVDMDPRSFGFKLSPKEVISRTRGLLKGDLSVMNSDSSCRLATWVDIKDWVKENIGKPAYRELDEEYFKWIASLPLLSDYTYLPKKYDSYYLPLKGFFTILWDQANSGQVDYEKFPFA